MLQPSQVELSSKERSKLQAALTKIGSEYAQNVSGGEVFR